jgi:hypothetical protein
MHQGLVFDGQGRDVRVGDDRGCDRPRLDETRQDVEMPGAGLQDANGGLLEP